MYLRLKVPVDADVLICVGDACEGFNPADLQDFFTWYASIPARLRIFDPGNHDRIFNTEPVRARNMVPGSIVLLESEGMEYDGINFFSVPARPYLKGLVSIRWELIHRHAPPLQQSVDSVLRVGAIAQLADIHLRPPLNMLVPFKRFDAIVINCSFAGL